MPGKCHPIPRSRCSLTPPPPPSCPPAPPAAPRTLPSPPHSHSTVGHVVPPPPLGRTPQVPTLLHLATLSGVLACLLRNFKASLSSLPLLSQTLGSLPLGTWDCACIGDSRAGGGAGEMGGGAGGGNGGGSFSAPGGGGGSSTAAPAATAAGAHPVFSSGSGTGGSRAREHKRMAVCVQHLILRLPACTHACMGRKWRGGVGFLTCPPC